MSLHSSPAPKLPPNKYPLWHENNFPSYTQTFYPLRATEHVPLIFDVRTTHFTFYTSQRFNNIPIIPQRYSFPVDRDPLITSNNTPPPPPSPIAKTSTCESVCPLAAPRSGFARKIRPPRRGRQPEPPGLQTVHQGSSLNNPS